MDATQGIHFNSEALTHPAWKTISNVECACGCKTLLSQKTVDKGWTVLRGHKKAIGVHHGNALPAKVGYAPRAKVVSTTSMDSIDQFIGAEMELVTTQLAEAINKRTDIEVLIRQLTIKKDKLTRARAAIKEL